MAAELGKGKWQDATASGNIIRQLQDMNGDAAPEGAEAVGLAAQTWLLLRWRGLANLTCHPESTGTERPLWCHRANLLVTSEKSILPWPPRVRKGIRLMAMGTVPCLLWKWWTWWVVLREEETRAATAGQGNTTNARESTSRNRKAGLAHTTGDAAGLGTTKNPSSTSTSTSCSIGAGLERKRGLLPLIRHKQEMNISNESGAHDSLLSSAGRG